MFIGSSRLLGMQHALQAHSTVGDPLQAFLKANVEVVDAGVTAHLLASYGRMDDLMHFASYRQVQTQANSGSEPRRRLQRWFSKC